MAVVLLFLSAHFIGAARQNKDVGNHLQKSVATSRESQPVKTR